MPSGSTRLEGPSFALFGTVAFVWILLLVADVAAACSFNEAFAGGRVFWTLSSGDVPVDIALAGVERRCEYRGGPNRRGRLAEDSVF